MIENLNISNFNQFGSIYNEDFKEVCHLDNSAIEDITHLNLTRKSINTLQYTSKSVSVLGLTEGLAVLCVSLNPSTGEINTFLLDKTVIINKGVFYNVVPLYGVCSLQLGKEKNEKTKEYFLSEEFTPLGIYPKVKINNVYTLFYQEKESKFLFKGEKHNFWELTYVDKGILYNSIDGKIYVTTQGQLVFFSENQYHIQWTDEKTPASFITITFDMDFDDSSLISNRIFSIDDDLKSILRNIIIEKGDGLNYSNDIIICYLKIFIIRLIRNDKLESTIESLKGVVKNTVENSIISQVLEYIHNNIDKRLSIPDIAKHVHLSQSYLSTLFKQNMDVTIIDYINTYRLEKSKQLIKSSQYNITQIADMLGYASIHYFSRQFKSHFGISPTAYAQSAKNNSMKRT